MAASEFPQHERLTRVLNIYRSAMRRHIANQWRAKYAESWFDELYSYFTGHQQEEIRNTRETLDTQRAEGGVARSKEEENEFLVDIAMFLEAVKSRSDLFGELTEPETTNAIYAVYQLRNTWAHPPLRDLSRNDVLKAVDLCERVLRVFDEEAADAVREVGEADLDSPTPSDLAEQIERLHAALEQRGMPTEQLSGVLNQMLELVSDVYRQLEDARAAAAETRAANRTALNERFEASENKLMSLVRDGVLTLTEQLQQARSEIEAMRGESKEVIGAVEAAQKVSHAEQIAGLQGLGVRVAELDKQLALVGERQSESDSRPTLEALRSELVEVRAELRALRTELAASHTQAGEWWARFEQQVSSWLDRLARVGRK